MAKTYTPEEIASILAFATKQKNEAVANAASLLKKVNALESENNSLKQKISELGAQLAEHYIEIKDVIVVKALDALYEELSMESQGTQVKPTVVKPTAVKESSKAVLKLKEDIDYTFLASNVEKFTPLKLSEMNALLQLPNRVVEAITSKGVYSPTKGKVVTLKKNSTYNDLLEFVNGIKPLNSTVKSINPFHFLHISHVEEILSIPRKAIRDLVDSGKLAGIKLDKHNMVFFWKDVMAYIKAYKLDFNHIVVPHIFYAKLYRAIFNDSVFSKFENDVIFGFVEVSTDWNLAHGLLGKFDPTIAKFMDSYATEAKGNLSVRSWLRKHRPNLLQEMLDLGESGYFKYLTKYTTYDNKGKLLILSVTE